MEDQDLSGFSVRPFPGSESIRQGNVALLPFDLDRDAESLWNSFGPEDALWTYMAYGPFADRKAFDEWLVTRAASQDPWHMTIEVDGAACGSMAYMALRPDMGVAEIGHVLLSPKLQQTRAATRAFALALSHLFELDYRRVEWKCDGRNQPSRRAALRLGFRFEGLFRQHMIVKGRNRDTAWFALLDYEWPAMARAIDLWLCDENFDEAGRQRRRLAEIAVSLQ